MSTSTFTAASIPFSALCFQSRRVIVQLDTDLSLELIQPRLIGSSELFGTGCTGSQGLLFHTVNGEPVLGGTADYVVAGGMPNSSALMLFGLSDRLNGSLPLPFALDVLGAPACTLDTEVLVTLPVATDSTGGDQNRSRLRRGPIGPRSRLPHAVCGHRSRGECARPGSVQRCPHADWRSAVS